MADFGFAFETSTTDDTNPIDWAGSGTQPYIAPEAWSPSVIRGPPGNSPGTATETYQLTSQTNVWGT